MLFLNLVYNFLSYVLKMHMCNSVNIFFKN